MHGGLDESCRFDQVRWALYWFYRGGLIFLHDEDSFLAYEAICLPLGNCVALDYIARRDKE